MESWSSYCCCISMEPLCFSFRQSHDHAPLIFMEAAAPSWLMHAAGFSCQSASHVVSGCTISASIGWPPIETACVAGLLHSIGVIMLGLILKKEWWQGPAKLLRKSSRRQSLGNLSKHLTQRARPYRDEIRRRTRKPIVAMNVAAVRQDDGDHRSEMQDPLTERTRLPEKPRGQRPKTRIHGHALGSGSSSCAAAAGKEDE